MIFDDNERKEYARIQCQSLREAIPKTRDTQNTILQWNQAISGALFIAALVTARQGYVTVAQFLFSIILPAILLSGALAWSGELIRMSRASVFLRAFERCVWNGQATAGLDGTGFFVWEHFLWEPPQSLKESGYRNQNVGYVGIALFYGVMYLGALVGFALTSPWWLSCIVWSALVLLGKVVIVPPVRQIFRLGGRTPSFSANDLVEWMNIVRCQNEKKFLSQGGALAGMLRTVMRVGTAFRRRPASTVDGGIDRSQCGKD